MARLRLFLEKNTMLIFAVTQTMIECNSCRIPLQRKGGRAYAFNRPYGRSYQRCFAYRW